MKWPVALTWIMFLGLAPVPGTSESSASESSASESDVARGAYVAPLAAQAALHASEDLELIVWLRHQPLARIAAEQRARFDPMLLPARAEVRALDGRLRVPFPSATIDRATWLRSIDAEPGDPTLLAELRESLDRLQDALRHAIGERVRDAVADDQRALQDRIAGLGGSVLRPIPLSNSAVVRLPPASLTMLATDPTVARIEPLPQARLLLDVQRTALGLDDSMGFWAQGIAGSPSDIGLLDTGVQQDHPAFTNLRIDSLIGTSDPDGHGTALAGIMAANDAGEDSDCIPNGTICGVAWATDTLLVGSSAAVDVLADADWMITTATQAAEAINLSTGYGTADDVDYSGFDASWDGLIDAFDVTVCVAAGNGGPGATSLTHPANAYNVITVANLADQNTVDRDDDIIAMSSSRGPTLLGRKKPDLSAPGELTRTTNSAWATEADFVDISGSSAAAPHCTAAALLLSDKLHTVNPLKIKALMIESADSWSDGGTPNDPSDDGPVLGSEWNATYGWGAINLSSARRQAPFVLRGVLGDGTGAAPRIRLFRASVSGDEPPAKFTVVWNRHVSPAGPVQSTAIDDLNNLDISLYENDNGTIVASSTSPRDNVEQVSFQKPGPGSGTVVLKVELVGALGTDRDEEPFAVALPRGFARAVPFPSLRFSPPFSTPKVSPGRTTHYLPRLRGGTVPGTFNTSVHLSLPPGYILESGDNPVLVPSVGSSHTLHWDLRAACDLTPVLLGLEAEGTIVGETVTANASFPIQPTVTHVSATESQDITRVDQTFSFEVEAGRWSALLNKTTTRMSLDNDLCIESPYLTEGTRLMVVNGVVHGTGTHYALVTPSATSPNTVNGELVARGSTSDLQFTLADTIALDVPHVHHFFLTQNLLALQVPVEAGRHYAVRLATNNPHLRLNIRGFEPDQPAGDARSADALGSSSLVLTPEVDGLYAIAIEANRFAQLTTTISEIDVVFFDNFESGDTSAWSAVLPQVLVP